MARRIMARRIMCGALEFDQESCEEVTFAQVCRLWLVQLQWSHKTGVIMPPDTAMGAGGWGLALLVLLLLGALPTVVRGGGL